LKVIPNYGVQILKITQMCHPNEQSKIDVWIFFKPSNLKP
jgi:hypothetical protein